MRGRRVVIGALAALLGTAASMACSAQAPPEAPAAPEIVEQVTPTTQVLQAVSPVSEDVVWVGGHGVILSTSDGGATWTAVPAPGGDTLQFRDVHAFSGTAAVTLTSGTGALSRIYRTDDGGHSWALQFIMDEPAGFLDCLDFWDTGRGFAYGDSVDGKAYVLLTDDGGRTWDRAPAEGTPRAPAGEGGFAASGTCARTGADGLGWIGTGAGGSARILTTTDYGSSWTAARVPVATGPSAGVFTLAVDGSRPILALGGDLGTPEDIAANAATPVGPRRWAPISSAPIAGAVYGSDVGQWAAGPVVVAVAPTGAAYTGDGGLTWSALDGVAAWAVAFAPGGRVGWASGASGRIWRITSP